MAARGKSLEKLPLFTTVLASAALEWLLIFLLFIHGIFSYSITKFARYCNLQVPCLLCSRIDHIFGSEKRGFYWDLICRHHKLEISSLVVCHIHNKLVDVHDLCENCLFSFATINKSKAEIYRLLVGKLGEISPVGLDEDRLEDKKQDNNKNICSCCKELSNSGNHAQKFLQSQFELVDLKNREEPTQALDGFDCLPHVEYSKVKNFSDTESEIPFSDEDDGIAQIRESAELRDLVVKSVPMVPRIDTLPDYLMAEKLIHTDSISELSLLDLRGQSGNTDPEESKHVSSTMAIGHGLEENSSLYVEPKVELTTEVPRSANPLLTQVRYTRVCVDGTETVKLENITGKDMTSEEIKTVTERETSLTVENKVVMDTVQSEQRSSGEVTFGKYKPGIEREACREVPCIIHDTVTGTVKSEKMTFGKVTGQEIKLVVERKASPKLLSVTEAVELQQTISQMVTHEGINPVIEPGSSLGLSSKGNDKITETIKLEQISSDKVAHEETRPEGGPSSEALSAVNDSIAPVPYNMEFDDVYKLAVGNRIQLSGKPLEQRSPKEFGRITDDLKLLLTQLSVGRGIEQISPRLSGFIDELRMDSSNISGTQFLQRRVSLERNESGISLEGSVLGEIEGESEVERLKRQVEHDKRLMVALYKELEEERSASAISANQAMAMITRLQEEKASLQMEALQCVRMMEEQAEYDVEALQQANDLLTEKEKEIQDLEADLEFLSSKLDNISMIEREMEPSCGLGSKESAAEQSDSNHSRNSENVDSNFTVDKPHAFGKDDVTFNSYSELEDERLCFLECLRKLEKNIHLFSPDGLNLDVAETANSQRKDYKEGDLKKPCRKEGTQEMSSKETEKDCDGKSYSRISRTSEAVAIGDAVSYLIKRLEALETDRNGIDHSVKYLKRGGQKIKQP